MTVAELHALLGEYVNHGHGELPVCVKDIAVLPIADEIDGASFDEVRLQKGKVNVKALCLNLC